MHIIIYKDHERWEPLIYKDIKDKYEISTYGRIRNRLSGKILSTCKNEKGYCMTCLMTTRGVSRCFKTHILVANTFIPKPILITSSDKLTINHKNGDKDDNSIYNLEWITFSENIQHSYREGLNTPRKGELNGMCKHNEDVIRFICGMIVGGHRPGKIIKEVKFIYGDIINKYTVSDIKRKKRWRHIADEYF